MMDLIKVDGKLQEKLEKFEKLLGQIEQNGRSNPEEKFYVWRKDLDGKLVSLCQGISLNKCHSYRVTNSTSYK